MGGYRRRGFAAVAAFAAWIHWRNFRVPITIAAGAASVAAIAVSLLFAAIGQDDENAKNIILGFVLLLGIGVFLFAMWWDASDRARLTRRADVAFWLHLLAAPMIVHPVFTLLGLTGGHASIGEGSRRGRALHRSRASPPWRSTGAPCSSPRSPTCSMRCRRCSASSERSSSTSR